MFNNLNEKRFRLRIRSLDMHARLIALRLYKKTGDNIFLKHAEKLQEQIKQHE